MNNTETLNLNIGPQHPSTHGVLRLNVTLDGEFVQEVQPAIGYLHRGMEKLAQTRSFQQYLPMVDRVDYLSGFFYSALMCYSVEKAAGIVVPKRAEYIRLITMELNRIASHLLWLGTFLLDLGATTPLFYCFREREEILKILEDLSGQRMMYNYYCFGGVYRDLNDGFVDEVKKFCDKFPHMIDEYEKIITSNPVFLDRTKGVGVLSREEALEYGISGANLRASGVKFDVRKDMSYSFYDEMDFDVPTLSDGDCYARYMVRISEMRESCRIILQALSQIPGGGSENLRRKKLECACESVECEFCGDDSKIYLKKINPITLKVPECEITTIIEAPRGLASLYLKSDGGEKPARIKWRTPSFASVQLMPALMKGALYADLIAILGSLDIVLPEVDR